MTEKPCDVILSDEQLLDYLYCVERKQWIILIPLQMICCMKNLKIVDILVWSLYFRQFRHISFHTGMLNGQTALATGKFPMWVSETEKVC